MPNRRELKAPVERAQHARPDDLGVWTVVGLCVIGALASIDFAAYLDSVGHLSSAVNQTSAMALIAP